MDQHSIKRLFPRKGRDDLYKETEGDKSMAEGTKRKIREGKQIYRKIIEKPAISEQQGGWKGLKTVSGHKANSGCSRLRVTG